MIIGVGTDIVDIRRIEKMLADYPDRFIQRTFTEEEQATANARKEGGLRAATYARRFAAKEACAKALGTAIRDGILFTDFSLSNDNMGKPCLSLNNKALEVLRSLIPAGKAPKIHVSLSDDPPYALAFVTIEAV